MLIPYHLYDFLQTTQIPSSLRSLRILKLSLVRKSRHPKSWLTHKFRHPPLSFHFHVRTMIWSGCITWYIGNLWKGWSDHCMRITYFICGFNMHSSQHHKFNVGFKSFYLCWGSQQIVIVVDSSFHRVHMQIKNYKIKWKMRKSKKKNHE